MCYLQKTARISSMQINTIFIPSYNEEQLTNPHLTLIHGWGAESRVWEDWAREYLSPYYSITLIDLPGFGESPEIATTETLQEDWLQAIESGLPEKTHLLGWSLGGLISQQIALRNPEKIESLICLASTPRFTQNDGWKHSISPQIIHDFIKAISFETNQALKKFWRWQLQGIADSRAQMKALINHMRKRTLPSIKTLNQGLILLKDIDNRSTIKDIQMPTLWLLGEHDPLVPQEMRANLPELQPKAEIHILEDGSHIPFFSDPEPTAKAVLQFLNAQAK